jgi:putative nucleotidyltransferase with HDIG domain
MLPSPSWQGSIHGVTPPPSIAASVSAKELKEKVKTLFSSPQYRPPVIAPVALELLEVSRKPEVDAREVASMLERDPVLAGRVLKKVQSAALAGRSDVKSLQQAVVRLGVGGTRDLVIELAVGMRLFIADGYASAMENIRRHCALTAHACRALSLHLKLPGGVAFLQGLLHDMGIAISLIALAEVPRGAKPDLTPWWKVIHEAHAEVGGIVAKEWKLPPELRSSIESHHSELDLPTPSMTAAMICVAQELANRSGASVSGPENEVHGCDAITPAQFERACAVLKLPEATLESVRQQALRLLQEAEA